MSESIPGLVFRPRTDGLSGQRVHRWDVTTAKALETLLASGSNGPFARELIGKARNAVRNDEIFQGEGITKVTKKRGKMEFDVQVTLFRLESNGDTRTKKITVPVIEPDCYSDYDLRAAFGEPIVMNS